jgi:hypothetical protein
MRHHDAPAGTLSHLAGADGLGHGANLVDLQQQGAASLLIDGSLDALDVSDQQIVAHNLNLASQRCSESRVSRPVVLHKVAESLAQDDLEFGTYLIERILNGHHIVVLGELLVARHSVSKCQEQRYHTAQKASRLAASCRRWHSCS